MSAIAAAPVGTRRAVYAVPASEGGRAPGGRAVVATHLKLTRRGRIVLAALAAAPLVTGLAVGALGGEGAVASSTAATTEFTTVTVDGGDTLWQLAAELAPAADPRDVISDIVRLNGLSTSEVQPGQQLAIPAEYAG